MAVTEKDNSEGPVQYSMVLPNGTLVYTRAGEKLNPDIVPGLIAGTKAAFEKEIDPAVKDGYKSSLTYLQNLLDDN